MRSDFLINEESERNILRLKSLWLNSIDTIAKDEERVLILVNFLNIADEPLAPGLNPYRTLYKEIIREARRRLADQRLFYFSPSLPIPPFSVEQKNGFSEASADGKSFSYDTLKLKLVAYGEHTDEKTKGGCIDSSVRILANALGIQNENVTIDSDRSLPLLPTIRREGCYYPPDALYLTVAQISELSDK